MKKIVLLLFAGLVCSPALFAQKQDVEKRFASKDAIAQFTYLASDALMGRDPIRPEMKMAYTFIAQVLEKAGAKPLPGGNGYYQDIPFNLSSPPTKGSVRMGDFSFSQGQNLLVLDANF